jgi:hypothetical protein
MSGQDYADEPPSNRTSHSHGIRLYGSAPLRVVNSAPDLRRYQTRSQRVPDLKEAVPDPRGISSGSALWPAAAHVAFDLGGEKALQSLPKPLFDEFRINRYYRNSKRVRRRRPSQMVVERIDLFTEEPQRIVKRSSRIV